MIKIQGSGITRAELTVCTAVGAACTAVLVWLVVMVAGAVPGAQDGGAAVQGGAWSRDVSDACGRGPAECDRVLREVNADASRYGIRVYEDGSVTGR